MRQSRRPDMGLAQKWPRLGVKTSSGRPRGLQAYFRNKIGP